MKLTITQFLNYFNNIKCINYNTFNDFLNVLITRCIFKKCLCISLLLTFSFTANCQIKGNGQVIIKNRKTTPFSKIIASDGWDIVLSQGKSYSLKIEAEENLIDLVTTEVKNGVLKIYSKKRIKRSKRRRIHITFRELNSIVATGSTDIATTTSIQAETLNIDLSESSDIDNFTFEGNNLIGTFKESSDVLINFISINTIKIRASGSSDIILKNIAAEKCSLNLSGSSDAILNGSVAHLNLNASGSVDIEAYNLEVSNGILNLSGASDAEMNVTNSLAISLSGGSDLELKGNPKIIHQDLCDNCVIELN